MKLQWTEQFAKEYRKLPEHMRKQADQKLILFLENPSHPSLRTKKMKGLKIEIYELSVTMNYRITFQTEADVCLLRRIGTHDILKRP